MSGNDTKQASRHGTRGSAPLLALIGTLAAIALWWGATVVFGIREIILPAPPVIVDRFLQQPDYLLKSAWETLQETVVGYGIAVPAALLTAMLLAASRRLEQATLPMLVAVNSIPKVALAPLLVVWFDFGIKPKIFLAALISFFPLVVSAMSGLTSTPADLGELSRSLTASWRQSYLKIRLPWALPQIFVGLKVSIVLAPVGAVVAENANPGRGLGSVITLAGTSSDTALAFAAIMLLAIVSVALYYVVVAMERLLLPWAREIAG